MRPVFLLARRYISFYKLKTFIMVFSITLTAYLPISVYWLLDYFQTRWMERAQSTPLIIGAKGSRFDQALHTLYFQASVPGDISMREVNRVRETGYALAIPINIKHTAGGYPVVGTTLDYFGFRGLEPAQGTQLIRLGDCLLGAEVAHRLELAPGDRLLTDPENVFDISSEYPLNMRVAGILARSRSADDHAVFVDIKTAWIIQGIGHGHQDLAVDPDENLILDRNDDNIVANAALLKYNEITGRNINSFHFHGAPGDFPLTAVIAVPHDQKSKTLLAGRYLGAESRTQVIYPDKVIEELFSMIIRIKRFFDMHVVMVTISTVLFLALIILLSLQLRRREIATMFKLGCSRNMIFLLQAAELVIIIACSFTIAILLSVLTLNYAADIVQIILT